MENTPIPPCVPLGARNKASLATWAWMCPVLSWAMRLIGSVIGRESGGRQIFIFAMAELALLVAGPVIGIIVLNCEHRRQNRYDRVSALIGIAISTATMALGIFFLAVLMMRRTEGL